MWWWSYVFLFCGGGGNSVKFCVSITLGNHLTKSGGARRDVFGDPQGLTSLFHLSSLGGFKIGLALTLLFSVWFVLCFSLFFIFVVVLTVFNCFCLFLFSFFARILIFPINRFLNIERMRAYTKLFFNILIVF